MELKRPTIALAMIVKNEVHNLPRLFKSVEGCFDQIHITDTGSNDGTQEVIKKFGAELHHFDWVDDFSLARNASFRPVQTDYVFWMDADDVLENREAFILWRDTAMGFADYWLANYHYSLDAQGKPNCTFVRERCFRTDRQFRWKYFVHEGVLPDSGVVGMPVRTDFISTWSIKHMRSDFDLKQDRSRNLRLFESKLSALDARMRYYYGKELFENNMPLDAFKHLVDAIAEPKLEMHDRILGLQYACFAAMACNQFEKSIQLAHQGLQLAPNRAEFQVIMGDCYCKLGKLIDAIPAYAAAKSSFNLNPQGGNHAGPIFTNSDAYGIYPRNQIARIFGQLGDFEKAKKEAKECLDLFGSPETIAILNDIEKYSNVMKINREAQPCRDIVITCPPTGAYEWDADLAKERSMGGSETAAIEMAKWLHQLSGRPVKIFNPRQTVKVCEGVEYIPVSQAAEWLSKNKPYFHIAWRHNFKVTDAPTFVWCHDLITPGAENSVNYDKILCLTQFHKRYLMARQGIPEDKIWVTRNGIKPERFKDGPWEKDPFKFVFSSSPDRGLDRAMRVLDKVRETYPEVKLHVFYGIEHLPQWGHAELHARLKQMMEDRKDWVIYHGATQQEKLMKEFKTAAYCVQPSDFIETSMISAMERLCCGVYQIIRAVGGAVDTLSLAHEKGMAELIDSECITESDYQVYIDATLKAIETQAYKKINVNADQYSWEQIAHEWLSKFDEMTGDQIQKEQTA